MKSLLHKKRGGTGGVSGQLYETKLLSLILFRALHDDDIEEFYIGTNVDGLGEFDDVCFRFKMKGYDKPVAIFIQAKHRDNLNRRLAANTIDLPKYFDSYLKIRNKFEAVKKDDDAFFQGTYYDVECAFIYYTTTKDDLGKHYEETNYIKKINSIICTGADAFQPSYTDKDIELLHEIILREKIKNLGAEVANIVKTKGDDYEKMMKKDLLIIYHVILAQKVFDITDELQEDNKKSKNVDKYRIGRFKSEFFDTYNEHLLVLKDSLFAELLKSNKPDEKTMRGLLNELFDNPSELTLSKLIGCVIVYNDTKLEFINKDMNRDVNLKERLDRVNVSQSAVARAIDIAGRDATTLAEFKLHRSFGNSDLTVRNENRIDHLARRMKELLNEATECDVYPNLLLVNIDENFVERNLLHINGGIAGAVGNLLVYDEQTKLLKFNHGALNGYAKSFFEKINVPGLDRFRLNVRKQEFPKLVFEYNEYDTRLIGDFKSKLLFCTSQATQREVEKNLKDEINKLEDTRDQFNFQIKSDAIYLKYHDEVQKWWMKQKEAEYLTKKTLFYQSAREGFIGKPLLSITNVLNKNRITSNCFQFTTNAVDSLKFDESNSTIAIIASEVIDLSVAKVSQYYKDKEHILIDLNYILSLPRNDRTQLDCEMLGIKEKTFILTFNSHLHVLKIYEGIEDILLRLDGNKRIVITSDKSARDLKKNLGNFQIENIDDECNLLELTQESQQNVFENTNVTFQGQEVNMNVLFDEESKVCIKGEQINKIINGEFIEIGEPLTDSKYDEIKQLYVTRNVAKTGGRPINLETFYDLEEHTVLITAMPGMGKSCLLTHLSLKTKAHNHRPWIARINLVDFSKFFGIWLKTRASIDILEALRFTCIALIGKLCNEKDYIILWNDIIRLVEDEGEIRLDTTRLLRIDDSTELNRAIIFNINMFLHFCNKRKVIFLFDGFDEICPYYKTIVTQFLSVLKDYRPREHRLWITSRTYNEILDSLEQTFGVSYQLQPFTYMEQEIYLERFLKKEIDFIEQKDKINEFIMFMAQSYNWRGSECLMKPMHTVYFIAAQYFRNELKRYMKVAVHNSLKMPSRNVYEECKGYWNYLNAIDVMSTPLHIKIVADYFQSEMKDDAYAAKWDQNAHTFAMYERFMDTKFEKICLVEKCNMDLSIPNVQNIIERERETFIDIHKKLAAYGIFTKYADRIFNGFEMEDIRKTLNSIRSGKEKTGVIHSVIDDVPRFVHLTFAEYFAVDYICDLLKMETTDERITLLWDFVLNTMLFKNNVGVLNIFDDKLGADTTLKSVVSEDRHRRTIFDLLMKQSAGVSNGGFEHDACLGNIIHSSLHKALVDDLRNMTKLLLSTLEFVNDNNLHKLIEIIVRTEVMRDAIEMNKEEFVHAMVNIVRKSDESRLEALFKNMPFDIPSAGTNREIIECLRSGLPRLARSPTEIQNHYYKSFVQNSYGVLDPRRMDPVKELIHEEATRPQLISS